MVEEEPRLLLPLQLPEEEEAVDMDGARHSTPRCTHTAAMAVAEVLPLLPPQLLPAAAAVDLVDHTAAGAAVAEVLLPLLPPQLLRAAAAVDLVDRTVSAVSRRRLSWLRLPLRSLPDE